MTKTINDLYDRDHSQSSGFESQQLSDSDSDGDSGPQNKAALNKIKRKGTIIIDK